MSHNEREYIAYKIEFSVFRYIMWRRLYMSGGNGLDQLCFLTLADISFGNAPLFYGDIPEQLKEFDDAIKIMEYNNQNKGIITNDFFIWALKNNISHDVVRWFIKDFSNQGDKEIEWLVDALFNHYTIYLDESSNCVKFRFKDIEGTTNVKWYNDFVLSGLAFEGNSAPIDIDMLFDKFKLQKSNTDPKLKHIADYNGEDSNRFIDILKSKKVSILLETLFHCEYIYIHWATQNLLYFSLVDIVDSVLNVPFIDDAVKNILYNYALQDINSLLSLLAKYDYPNIKEEMIRNFCEEFICWIDSLKIQNSEEEFLLEFLRQGIKSSRRTNSLLFLQDNTDKLLIESFVPIYAMRVATFPNSDIHFDKCGIVENNIGKNIKIYCNGKIPNYDFLDSCSSRWIQLSDMISGIQGALMAYINVHDPFQISKDLIDFDEVQRRNLEVFMRLRERSRRKNKYFDNMSKNLQQIERIRFLMDYCNI